MRRRCASVSASARMGQGRLDEIEDHGGSRKREGLVRTPPNGAAEVDEDQIRTAPPDLEAE